MSTTNMIEDARLARAYLGELMRMRESLDPQAFAAEAAETLPRVCGLIDGLTPAGGVMSLRLQMECLLTDFPARTTGGFWSYDCDTDDYKRGAIEDETFWRTQIRRALDATGETSNRDPDHETVCACGATGNGYCKPVLDARAQRIRDAFANTDWQDVGAVTPETIASGYVYFDKWLANPGGSVTNA